jgi:hypothetical protein
MLTPGMLDKYSRAFYTRRAAIAGNFAALQQGW